MEKLICVKETPLKGRGIFAVRDIRKDEIISTFTGPRVKVERLDEFPPEVVDHLRLFGDHERRLGVGVLLRIAAVQENHREIQRPAFGNKGEIPGLLPRVDQKYVMCEASIG